MSIRKTAKIVNEALLVEDRMWVPRSLRSARDGAPFWICEADLVPTGEVPGRVPPRAAPWGIPVTPEQARRWTQELRKIVGNETVEARRHEFCGSGGVYVSLLTPPVRAWLSQELGR